MLDFERKRKGSVFSALFFLPENREADNPGSLENLAS
jgi:hypothetical protein